MGATSTFGIDGKKLEYPIVEGSEGERGIDVTKLRAQTGVVTLDPGFGNTASCKSAITFIDGEKGILQYRGIPIDELAQGATYLECANAADQITLLEHEAQVADAKGAPFALRERVQARAAGLHGPALRARDAGDQVQQRRLARAAGSEHANSFSPLDLQRRDLEPEVALRIAEVEVIDANHHPKG